MELLLELYKTKKEELNALHFNLLENFQNFNSKNVEDRILQIREMESYLKGLEDAIYYINHKNDL